MIRLVALIAVLLLTIPGRAQRQSTDALEQQRRVAQQEIKNIDIKLNVLKGSRRDLSQQLRLVKQRLKARTEVLRSIEAQISILDDRARVQTKLATSHLAQLDSIKTISLGTIGKLYADRNVLHAAPMLLADYIVDRYGYRRHMGQVLLRAMEVKADQIRSIQGELGFELMQIAQRKILLAQLKEDEAEQMTQIDKERVKIEQLSLSISADESSLSTEKSKRLQALSALVNQISEAIKKEVTSQNKLNLNKQNLENDPASVAFVALKGRLLCPVSPAKVVDSYGVHKHPTRAGVKVDNKGINVESVGGTIVRAVATGVVKKVFVVPAMGTSILLRHGVYLTVYSNLESITVSVGDKVDLGEQLGTLAADALFHFEIWRETTTQNPESWLKPII